MPDAFPKLRAEIDAAPAAREGETYYIVYDRSGVAPGRLLMSPLGLLIAGRLDGASSVLDIADALGREVGGEGIACAEVETIIAALDEAYFLDSPRFDDFEAQAARDFETTPVRPAGCAGQAYDADPAALAAALDRMMAEAPPPEEAPGVWTSHPRGVIAPHIDYARGGAGYGQVYKLLSRAPRPGTVVVLGTAHTHLRERFSLCDKEFETPLGNVPVDTALAGAIRRAVRPYGSVDADVLAHRGEHSIELQALWLRHIYGDGVRILPILVSSLCDYLTDEVPPAMAADEPAIKAMAECLARAVDDGAMIMASADLSHIGPRFGDAREVTNQFLAEVEEVDRQYLAGVAAGAVDGLSSLAQHGDKRHVCGAASIFTMGLALPNAPARLLGYHQAVTPAMRQAVTYAGMVMA